MWHIGGWHMATKRYTSMNGCVAAISADTGKVLDIEVMSSYRPTSTRAAFGDRPRNFEPWSSDVDDT
ncbi:hypothetical protein TNCV_3343061 [Trichonephila clavipes]|nr:hypothetical protein TNCV_3343061 [Trichonephila clavipes]